MGAVEVKIPQEFKLTTINQLPGGLLVSPIRIDFR
jgi:hypothetical protein